MKFLTFVDLHENKKALMELVERASQADIEFTICLGDISTFGRNLPEVLEKFNRLEKKFYLIPGNHEEQAGLLDKVLRDYPFCVNFHRQSFRLGDYLLLGYGGNGFLAEDPLFRKVAREWYGKFKENKLILATHGPPFGTKIDFFHNRHVGNKDYRKFIERIKPKLVICGHLHETAGQTDQIGSIKVVNPGREGMVIELK